MYLGISSYPCEDGGDQHIYSNSVIDRVISFMSQHGLNIYRMSMFSTVNPVPFALHYLQNCNYQLILDYFHEGVNVNLTPTELTWTMNRAKTIIPQLNAYGYADRLWIEPWNERPNPDLGVMAQQFVTSMRSANIPNKIVAIRYKPSVQPITDWIINDDDFWSGLHPYFEVPQCSKGAVYTTQESCIAAGGTWSAYDPPANRVARALSTIDEMLAQKIKCLCTECGAHTEEYPYYDAENVAATQYFLDQMKLKGGSLTLWTLDGYRDWTNGYQNYGLTFPSIAGLTLPYHNPLTSLGDLSVINGAWSVG